VFPRFLLAGAILNAAACSGGDDGDDVLHLRGADITEDDYRIYVVTTAGVPALTDAICGVVQQLTLDEYLRSQGDSAATEADFGNLGTPVPGQPPERKSQERAYNIVQDVCEDLGSD
jgi:hypothetical protein